VIAHRKVTGVWVDGFPVPVDDAGRSLREFLSEADFVTVIVADGRKAPHMVSLSGSPARQLADLTTAVTGVAAEIASGFPARPDEEAELRCRQSHANKEGPI
jgi:hypothetical protein